MRETCRLKREAGSVETVDLVLGLYDFGEGNYEGIYIASVVLAGRP